MLSMYFFVIFEVHHMAFRNDVYLEEYTDVSWRSINGIALEAI